jgi:putative selenium metabolism protein SsnA
MAIVLRNALLADLDPVAVEAGDLRIDGGRIVARGAVTPVEGDEQIDCGGAVVLPGLVNGHTHLYSALAVGMPPPPRPPRNFPEILQLVWWRLDRALDGESIEISGAVGALGALQAGTTTLIDHHASPNFIAGSLDMLERGVRSVGLRCVLCYETTDRHGREGRDGGLEENHRYLAKCASRRDGFTGALAGAHASFTLEDDSLDELAEMAERFQSGVHIHVAEDPCDEEDCKKRHGIGLVQRLADHGLLRTGSVWAHGTHLDADAIERVNAAGVTMAHNPRSNMNNAVGYAPVGRLKCPVMLGTDGIGADMFAEARHAWFKSRDGGAGISPNDVLAMLAASARRAGAALGMTLGRLSVGAAADIVITDYVPSTPLDSDNLAGHFLFALGSQHVRHVLIDGQWSLRDRQTVMCDTPALQRRGVAAARRLWLAMQSIPA